DVVVIRRVAISRSMKAPRRRGLAMLLRRALIHCLVIALALFVACAPQAVRAEAMGIALEGFPYPYPVHFMPITIQGEDLRLAYMDAPPVGPTNGRTVVLLHGRNFPASYWEPTI